MLRAGRAGNSASIHRFGWLSLTGNWPPGDAMVGFVMPFICLKVTIFSDLNTF